ncbi:anti-Muellerian hormone type-2 receptor isoform X2 [Lissotriton helveticus]
MLLPVVVQLCLLHGHLVAGHAKSQPKTCIFFKNTTLVKGLPHLGEILDGGQVLCSGCCHAIWNETRSARMVLFQGCMQENVPCPSQTCEAEIGHDSILQCSCSKDRCNEIMGPGSPGEESSNQGMRVRKSHSVLFHRPEVVELLEVEQNSTTVSAMQDLSALHCLKLLHTGHHAVVWSGTFHGEDVAIKNFQASSKSNYLNEWRILSYMTPMNPESVVRFLAAGCINGEEQEKVQCLILQYHPAGSLRSFLIQHTTDWNGTLGLAVSLASGLAFLHADVWKDGHHKPSIVHRDLTSQNVLVKADATCAISDFDLALMLPLCRKTGGQDAYLHAMKAVGTLRYMSPEILEGCVNMKCWEATLKQADVYSMSLIFWEIFSRCNSFYPSTAAVPAFRMAFEAELGQDIDFKEMWALVFVERRRPVLPEVWKGDPEIYCSLKETLEDCWDPDAEARLTAMCAEQRLRSLMAFNSPNQSRDKTFRTSLLLEEPDMTTV